MTFFIAPIVEGQTEDRCIERLLQRTWSDLLSAPVRLQVLQPSRCPRDALLQPEHRALAVKVEEASLKLTRHLQREAASHGLLLVLLDAEADCPKEGAPPLLARARALRGDLNVACVFAKRMFENWIRAGASTLGGVNGLPSPLPARDRFEEHSGSAWLDHQLRQANRARKYKKTVDALEFVKYMDLAECRANAPSFDKLCRDLEAHLPQTPALPETGAEGLS